MWYDQDLAVRKDEAIFARDGNHVYILLAHISQGSGYRVVAYDWFNIQTGSYNSCMYYKSADLAIQAYSSMGHIIYNGKLKVIT